MMPDWFTTSFAQPSFDWRVLAFRLAAATVFGLLVASIYRATRDLTRVAASFPGTLVMLCLLIGTVTQVIGDNVALAFSLVGALSIVRFRTAVQDTKDTAFVIFAVAVGMAVGAGHLAVAVGGILAVGCVAWLFRDPVRRSDLNGSRPYHVEVRLGWAPDAGEAVRRAICRHDANAEVIAAGSARKGELLELTYRLRLARGAGLAVLAADLKALDSVESMSVHEPRPDG